MTEPDLEAGLGRANSEKFEGSIASSGTKVPPSPISSKEYENDDEQPKPVSRWRRLLCRLQRTSWRCPNPPKEPEPEIRVQQVHGGPLGYPLVSRFQDSENNYMVYRRFGEVQARLLLEAQDDLRRLETKLHYLDIDETDKERGNDPKALFTRKLFNKNSSKERIDLMQALKKAFKEYAELMSASQTLVSLNKPTEADYTSVTNFMYNEKPLKSAEYHWVYQKEDLVSLSPSRDYAWLDATLEKVLKYCDGPIVQKLFVSKETAGKKGSPNAVEVYFTRARIAMCVNFIIAIMILAMMIAPIWILYHITNQVGTPQNSAACMGVLLVFTLFFSAGLSFFTSAKRHEVLAAAAAYCAVLVVFIGNVGNRIISG